MGRFYTDGISSPAIAAVRLHRYNRRSELYLVYQQQFPQWVRARFF